MQIANSRYKASQTLGEAPRTRLSAMLLRPNRIRKYQISKYPKAGKMRLARTKS